MTQQFFKLGFFLWCVGFVLSSCLKGERDIQVENITKGSKWGIRIGSEPVEVFSQLQQLGEEKDVSTVSVVYRQPYSRPEEIENYLRFYNYVTLQRNGSPYVERTAFSFHGNKVDAIRVGGAHLEEVDRWPAEASDGVAVDKEDTIDQLYQKLVAIYQLPGYNDYRITLPDKPLSKPFDPGMGNYSEWAFSFFVDTEAITKQGRSSVRLYFKNGKLDKIRHEYAEFDVVID